MEGINTSPAAKRRGNGLGLAGAILASLLVLQACRSTAPTAPGAPVGAEASPTPPGLPPDAPLAPEARWLVDLFAGTPVQVEGEADGSVRIQVPMKFAFDPGTPTTLPSTTPKAPLQAVLDKLSQSLKRRPAARLQAAVPSPSASERLAAIRSHLVSKGVPVSRVTQTGTAGDDKILLRLMEPSSGVKKLDDGSLPPTNAGRVQPATSNGRLLPAGGSASGNGQR